MKSDYFESGERNAKILMFLFLLPRVFCLLTLSAFPFTPATHGNGRRPSVIADVHESTCHLGVDKLVRKWRRCNMCLQDFTCASKPVNTEQRNKTKLKDDNIVTHNLCMFDFETNSSKNDSRWVIVSQYITSIYFSAYSIHVKQSVRLFFLLMVKRAEYFM